jgi:glutamate transport system permease protein
MTDLLEHGGEILQGLYTTVLLTLCAFPLALVAGTLMAVFRVSPIRPLKVVGTLYVELIRNTPLLLILIVIVFALPDAGLTLPLFQSLVLGLGLYSGTYICEIVRSGIRGVDKGQLEAARALGLPLRHVLGQVLLPQALRSMVQPLGTILISTALASALGAAVGVTELTGATRSFNLLTAQPVIAFVVAAGGYLLINLTVAMATSRIERKVRVVR